MPLQVWLPLTGDLSNNGFTDVPVISGTPVWLDNGKFGKCISLASRVMFKSTKLQSITNNNFSVAFWSRTDSSSTLSVNWVDLLGFYDLNTEKSGTGQFRFEACYASALRACSWHNNANYNFTEGSVVVVPESQKGEWHHVCVTIGDARTKTYKDGVLIADTATGVTGGYLEGTFWIGETNNIVGGMNDLRVYDHVLSPKEIKLLSQGLVAHYQLNDAWLEGTTNLASKPDCLSNTCYNGAKGTYGYGTNTDMYKTVGVFEGKLCSKLYMGTSGASARPYPYISNLFVSNGTNAPAYKTLSFDYFSTIGTYINPYKLGSGNATCDWTNPSASPSSGTFTNSGNIPIVAGKWNHITMILHGTTDANAEWGYIVMGDTHTSNTSNYWLFANMQLEEKDHATGYTDGTRSETIVYDSSGFNYHGKINTAMTISSDSARSNISTVFNGTDNAIQIPFNTMLGLTEAGKRDYTISVWTYKTSIGTDGYQTILGGPSGFELEARNAAGTDPQYVTWNWGKVVGAYEFNKWEHFCFVHTSSDSKLYVNGVLQGTGSSANVPIGNYFIGAWNTAPQQNYEGKMSDFRIYATALSAEDIQALYNAPVSIANNGTMITQGEFVEV